MTDSFQTSHGNQNSPVWKAIEKYTNTNMTIDWVPNPDYDDKLNVTLASGNLPDILLIDQTTASIVNAAKSGEFWDLGPYLKDYPNLSKANPVALKNSQIDGKTYGLYRSRPLGRNAIIYRKDWLKNLGLPVPKTTQQFYNMLYEFTYDDPDKDGKNDTYGMVVTNYSGPWDVMQSWFGVPNTWGVQDGKLVPAQTTPQYMTALNYFHKMYQNKLVNQDFAVMPSSDWNQPFEAGKAGVIVDVADRADQIVNDNPKLVGKIGILGEVAGPDGKLHSLSTSGFSGYYVIPKSSVKTVADLKKVLAFMDKLDSPKGQNLITDGVEGQNYKVVNGYEVAINTNNKAYTNEMNDLNQLALYIPGDEYYTSKPTALQKVEQKVEQENLKYLVNNPAESLFSQTYAQNGTELDNILSDARTKYIVGQINQSGLTAALAQWRQEGGTAYTNEINQDYKQTQGQ